MRKYFLILALAAMPLSLCAADVPSPAKPAQLSQAARDAVDAAALASAPVGSVPAPAPTTVSPNSAYMKEMADIVFDWLKVAISALVSGLAASLIALIAKRFQITLSQDKIDLLQNAAKIAVDRAEQYADNYLSANGTAPSGNQKLDFALAAMKNILSTTAAISFANDTLVHFIEAHVALLNGVNSPTLDSQAAVDPTLAAANVASQTATIASAAVIPLSGSVGQTGPSKS